MKQDGVKQPGMQQPAAERAQPPEAPAMAGTRPGLHTPAAARGQPLAAPAMAGTAAREIELKRRVAPGDLARLARHPALVGLQQGTASSTRLYTVYFDTPALRLARFAVAL